jgi:hypothetical protein
MSPHKDYFDLLEELAQELGHATISGDEKRTKKAREAYMAHLGTHEDMIPTINLSPKRMEVMNIDDTKIFKRITEKGPIMLHIDIAKHLFECEEGRPPDMTTRNDLALVSAIALGFEKGKRYAEQRLGMHL